jgi:sugar phosphate isomerase/epimerase
MKNLMSGLVLLVCLSTGFKAATQTLPRLGVIQSIDQDSLLYASGFSLLGESVGKMLSPNLTEEEFQANLKRIEASSCKVYVCNILFPASMKIAGPAVDEKQVLAHVDKVFDRAKKALIPLIVLGSGGSRRLPEGYDYSLALKNFTALCGKLALLAHKHGITVAIESLNRAETNFLNTLAETAEVVRKVNHPNFRLNADIYHMMKENEPPQHIINAGKMIIYVELAEKENRTFPGVAGDDFKPYFRALKSIGYQGPVVIEGLSNKLREEVPLAYTYLTGQLQEVFIDGK